MIYYDKITKDHCLDNRFQEFTEYLRVHEDVGRRFLMLCPGSDIFCDSCDKIIKDEYVYMNETINYVFCEKCKNTKLKEILND